MKFLIEADIQSTEAEKNFDSKQNLDTEVNQEQPNSYNTPELLKIKTDVEKEEYDGQTYDTMNDSQRTELIQEVIKRASNSNTLEKARLGISNAIKATNWHESLINYLSDLPENVNIADKNVELVSSLISSKKLDYEKNKSWLTNESLYDRNSDDLDYTIKAFTLINNKDMQMKDGENKFFKSDLNSEDFIDSGKIMSASQIRDKLNAETREDIDLSTSAIKKEANALWKDYLKKQGIEKSEQEIDQDTIATNKRITGDLVSALTDTFGLKKDEAEKLVTRNFKEGETFEYLLREILRGYGRGA